MRIIERQCVLVVLRLGPVDGGRGLCARTQDDPSGASLCSAALRYKRGDARTRHAGTTAGVPKLRVLVAEDDPAIRELVAHHFVREGLTVLEASDGNAALRIARDGVDAIVLDIGLPAIDGFDVVRTLRREGRTAPILVLTARSEEIDRIIGLELGADDYVTKPFSPRELVARLKAVLRRNGVTQEQTPTVLRFGRLEVDEAAREARVDDRSVALKPKEFALLLALASSPGFAFSRDALLARVWGYDFDGDERTVDVHVRRVRAKVEEQANLPGIIRTIHGFGYKFEPK